MKKRPINYKGWDAGFLGKAKFQLRLKHGECIQCHSVMWCKWGCTQKDYPCGMRDYDHPRWKEVAEIYLESLEEGNFDTSDEWTQELIKELEKRGH